MLESFPITTPKIQMVWQQAHRHQEHPPIRSNSGSWIAEKCQFFIVENQTQIIMGRDILKNWGSTSRPTSLWGRFRIFFTYLSWNEKLKWALKKYAHLCIRLGRSRKFTTNARMKEHFTPIQQKRGRVPIHLLVKVENENKKKLSTKKS